MAYTDPTATDFKAWFVRDFPYGATAATVNDIDITKAIAEAKFNFNSAFAADQSQYTMLVLYLAAHFLVMDIRASSQGIQGQYPWTTSSKSVGSVSESYDVPANISGNPQLAQYSKTYYGAKYLNLIYPQLQGQMFTVCGRTLP